MTKSSRRVPRFMLMYTPLNKLCNIQVGLVSATVWTHVALLDAVTPEYYISVHATSSPVTIYWHLHVRGMTSRLKGVPGDFGLLLPVLELLGSRVILIAERTPQPQDHSSRTCALVRNTQSVRFVFCLLYASCRILSIDYIVTLVLVSVSTLVDWLVIFQIRVNN